MKNLKIRMKILIGFGGILLITCLIIFMYRSALNQTEKSYDEIINNEIQMAFESRQIMVYMLEGRRTEKDFLARKDLKYLSKHKANCDAMINSAKNLANIAVKQGYEEIKNEAETIMTQAKKYHEVFKEVVNATVVIGTEPALGLRGKFRSEAHLLEKNIKSFLIKDANELLLTCRKHEKDFIMRKQAKYVERLTETVEKLKANIKSSNLPKAETNTLQTSVDGYENAFYAMVKQMEVIGSKSSGLIGNMRDAVHSIEGPVEKIDILCVEAQENKKIITSKTVNQKATLSILVAMVGCVVAIILGFSISKSIVTPIKKVLKTVDGLAKGKGDLTERLKLNQSDEMGELANSIDEMLDSQSKMIASIKNISFSLGESSQQLLSVSDDVGKAAESTKNQANSVASATEEMSANINSMASATEEMNVNISSVSSSTEQTSSNMNTVASAIEEMSTSINQVAENSKQTSSIAGKAKIMAGSATEKMNLLDQAGQEIGKVTDTIKRIAEQTNLLALNATIEAASAGEAGKGFAVVAGEIKELANQSAKAAEDIANKIKGVQVNTNEAVSVIGEVTTIITEIDDSVSLITKAVQLQNEATRDISKNVNESNEGAKSISKSISEVSQGTRDLSKNAAEAAKGSVDVSKSIQEVSNLAIQSEKRAEQVNESSTALSKLAGELKTMVDEFKV